MKIIILGRGNAGCISAMHFSHFTKSLNTKVEIELIYDSKIKPVPTGQGTTLDFPISLSYCFGSNYFNAFPITQKTGIMYENWSKKHKNIFHPFPLGRYALHFSPDQFQDYVCNNLKIDFTERDKNIKTYDSLDADYIIDCRGTPKNFDQYENLINPLNCALLSDLPKKENDVKWTRAIATPDGWCFYIPLPTKTSIGYIFNKKITSIAKATKNFKQLFKINKVNHVFPFHQYMAKEPIIDRRVLLNGNRLFFLEPLEATAMGTYLWTSKCYYSYIFENHSKERTEELIKDYIDKIQNFILYHYSNYSLYKNKFWKHAKKLYNKTPTQILDKELKIIKGMSDVDLHRTFDRNNEFALWPPFSIKQWHDKVAS